MQRSEENKEAGVGKTIEDYLEAILMVKNEQGYVRSIDVAEKIGVAKPSVTYATKKLREAGYLTSDHAGMLVLTESGLKIATETFTRHSTLTDFFVFLGVDKETALSDACRVEHDLSQKTFDALYDFVKKQNISE